MSFRYLTRLTLLAGILFTPAASLASLYTASHVTNNPFSGVPDVPIATYGSLATEAAGGLPFLTTYFAAAGFDDVLTILGGSGAGVLTYHAPYLYFSDNGGGEAGNSICFNTSVCNGFSNTPLPGGSGIFIEQILFTFGDPFHFAVGLRSSADDQGLMGSFTIAGADLSISDLTVSCTGPCGTALTFASESNTAYPFTNAAFVQSPEPGTFVLGGALILLLSNRVRRTVQTGVSR